MCDNECVYNTGLRRQSGYTLKVRNLHSISCMRSRERDYASSEVFNEKSPWFFIHLQVVPINWLLQLIVGRAKRLTRVFFILCQFLSFFFPGIQIALAYFTVKTPGPRQISIRAI